MAKISEGQEPEFTAAQVAQALGITDRAVRKALQDVSPASIVRRQGGNVPRWKVAQLPDHYRSELKRLAHAAGCRSVEHLLQAPFQRWTPPVPFHRAREYYQVRAQKLQSALRMVLARQHELPRSELLSIGLRDYRASFGDSITPDYFWHLFDRTVQRAGLDPRWEDINLYLDENTTAAPVAPALVNPFSQCAELEPLLVNLTSRTHPTADEQRTILLHSFRWFEARTKSGQPARVAKRALLDFLFAQVPGLAPNANALRSKWDLKYKLWLAGGREAKALDDGRNLRRGVATGFALDPGDLEILTWHAAFNHAGKLAPAARELVGMGDESGLSAMMRDYLTADRKSSVPKRVANIVTPKIKMLRPHILGGLHKDNSLAYLKRDWTKVKPYECFCADDFTWPVYAWIRNADGSYALTRGQCLVFIDARTLRVLEYSLQPDRNYNSRVIRTLMTRVGENWAWPEAYILERGIWKDSKLIHGSTALPWGEVEYGLERLGTRFIHAIRARSKPVERVGGLLQGYMEKMPGYCGREERHDCPEITRKNKLRVERGENAEGMFLSFEQWEAEFAKICERYNAEPQQGDILNGLSPDEALKQLRDPNDAPRKFGPESRYLLAHHKSDKRVMENGITLRFGKQKYVYRDAQTGALRHQVVRCWWNPETPEMLTITDLDDKNPRCIPLSGAVHPLQVDETYLEEAAKAEAHNDYPKVLYRTLKAKFAHECRPNILDADSAELGREMNRMQQEFQQTTRRTAGAAQAARAVGLRISPEAAARPGAAEEIKELGSLLSEMLEDAGSDGTELQQANAPGKTYVLQASPASSTSVASMRKQLFGLWNKIEQAKPGLNRHAITHKALGYNKAVPDMTRGELSRCLEVFSAILRDAKRGEA